MLKKQLKETVPHSIIKGTGKSTKQQYQNAEVKNYQKKQPYNPRDAHIKRILVKQ